MKTGEYWDEAGRLWDLHEIPVFMDEPEYGAELIGFDENKPDDTGTTAGPCGSEALVLEEIERSAEAWLKVHVDAEGYEWTLTRRYADGQPDAWMAAHENYDGPEDNRCVVGRTRAECVAMIVECVAERAEHDRTVRR